VPHLHKITCQEEVVPAGLCPSVTYDELYKTSADPHVYTFLQECVIFTVMQTAPIAFESLRLEFDFMYFIVQNK
jgi:hypothetical protein